MYLYKAKCKLGVFFRSISSIPPMTLGPLIDDATQDSQIVNQTAKEIKETMNKVNQYLPNSLKQISQLPKDVDETLKSTELIKNQCKLRKYIFHYWESNRSGCLL